MEVSIVKGKRRKQTVICNDQIFFDESSPAYILHNYDVSQPLNLK